MLVLCHRAGTRFIEDYPDTPIPRLAQVVELVEQAAAWVSPAPVAAIALNTLGLGDEAARAEIELIEAETGVLCDDVVRFGAGRMLDAVVERLPPQR